MVLRDILRRNARRYPNKVAVVWGDVRYTFKQFNDRVNSIANALLDMGVRKGDRAGVLLDNCHQYTEIYCIGPKAGIAIVPLNSSLSGQELAYIINDAEANTLFLGKNYQAMVNSIKEEIKGVKNFITVGDKGRYEELIQLYPATEPEVEIDEEDLILISYTSGTTGLPKGVMGSDRVTLAVILNDIFAYRLTPDDIMLLTFPFFWGVSFSVFMPGFYLGCPFIIPKELTPNGILEAIDKERATTGIMTPFQLISLLEHPNLDRYNFSSLRHIVLGGEPLPVETLKRAIKVFGNIFSQGYGVGEAGFLTCLPPEEMIVEGPPEKVKRLQSCGREVANIEIRIVDENDNDVPPGQIGELIAKGDAVAEGYWKLPQATAETFRGGWLHSGDMATMDEEGYIYIMGRKRDIITSGGQNIYPTEVEEVLYHHPAVLEAAVIGAPHKELGEVVKAVVVLKEGKSATEEELLTFCCNNLASHAVPDSVYFVDRLPRTPSGKVLKRVLQEQYSQS